MKVIIAGGRDCSNWELLLKAIEESKLSISEEVCGLANGADNMGRLWALENNIPIKYFPADWNIFGKAAGYIRNRQMAEYADALIVLWDGKSKGTANMIKLAQEKQLIIYIANY